MQKSLIYLSQSIYTEAVQHFHVSIALFYSGVGFVTRVSEGIIHYFLNG